VCGENNSPTDARLATKVFNFSYALSFKSSSVTAKTSQVAP